MTNAAWGFGLVTYAADNSVLDVWFPAPQLGEKPADTTAPAELTALEGADEVRQVTQRVALVEVKDLESAPETTEDVWQIGRASCRERV